MKKFLIYALIIGCVGHMTIGSASTNLNHTAVKLAQLGE